MIKINGGAKHKCRTHRRRTLRGCESINRLGKICERHGASHRFLQENMRAKGRWLAPKPLSQKNHSLSEQVLVKAPDHLSFGFDVE